MELNIKININELLGKSKELDLSKILSLYQEIQAGKEIVLFNNTVKIKKLEDKK